MGTGPLYTPLVAFLQSVLLAQPPVYAVLQSLHGELSVLPPSACATQQQVQHKPPDVALLLASAASGNCHCADIVNYFSMRGCMQCWLCHCEMRGKHGIAQAAPPRQNSCAFTHLGVGPVQGLVNSIVQDVWLVVALVILQAIHPHNPVGGVALQQAQHGARQPTQQGAATTTACWQMCRC